MLDYDDLIDKTLALFARVRPPGWVLYKLDLGIDHVLIDEAQDTSPKQWEIVRTIVAEFAPARRARPNVRRTVFAVGDEKQSIFSFQGAAPRAFDEMRREFAGQFERPNRAGASCASITRSAPARMCSAASTGCSGAPRSIASVTTDPGRRAAAQVAARRRARARRDVAADRAGGAARDRRLGRAVRRGSGNERAVKLARDRKDRRAR